MMEWLLLPHLLLLVRVASFVAFLPPLAGGGVPRLVKLGLAVSLTWLWGSVGTQTEGLPMSGELSWGLVVWWGAREVFVGIGLAWLLGLLFTPLRIAGAYIAQEMGLTLASLTSPVDQQETGVLPHLLEMLGMLLFLALDGQHGVLRLFNGVLQQVPLGSRWTIPTSATIPALVGRVERAGLELAAPLGGILFLVTVLLAFLSRWAPQFQVMTVGSAIRVVAGLGLLMLLLPDFVSRMVVALRQLELW